MSAAMLRLPQIPERRERFGRAATVTARGLLIAAISSILIKICTVRSSVQRPFYS